jgi:hypothetical protein
MHQMRDPGCDNQDVSPKPAQLACAGAIAAEIVGLASTDFALPGILAWPAGSLRRLSTTG